MTSLVSRFALALAPILVACATAIALGSGCPR